MTGLTLHYEQDPSTGLPRLHDPSGTLDDEDRQVLERAINQHYARLTQEGDHPVLTLTDTVRDGLPTCYRVTVADRRGRCPTLILEAVDEESLSPYPMFPQTNGAPTEASEQQPLEEPLPQRPGSRWALDFLATAAEQLSELPTEAKDRSALQFVLSDLRTLVRKDSGKVSLLLLVGYLHTANALWQHHGGQGQNKYRQAATVLANLEGGAVPEGIFGSLVPSEPKAAQAESWWSRFWRLFA